MDRCQRRCTTKRLQVVAEALLQSPNEVEVGLARNRSPDRMHDYTTNVVEAIQIKEQIVLSESDLRIRKSSSDSELAPGSLGPVSRALPVKTHATDSTGLVSEPS